MSSQIYSGKPSLQITADSLGNYSYALNALSFGKVSVNKDGEDSTEYF